MLVVTAVDGNDRSYERGGLSGWNPSEGWMRVGPSTGGRRSGDWPRGDGVRGPDDEGSDETEYDGDGVGGERVYTWFSSAKVTCFGKALTGIVLVV